MLYFLEFEPTTTNMGQRMNELLTKVFTVEEVKEVLKSIGDLKAPGPGGMPAIFNKKC